MVVATEDDCPPFEYTSNTRFVGFDNDLLELMKKSSGFDIRQERAPLVEVLRG